MRLVVLITTAIFALTAFSAEAYATRYECNAKNDVVWKDDSLIVANTGPMVVRFDDITGALWLGEDPKQPSSLKVIQGLHSDNDLVATREVTAGEYTGIASFRLRRKDSKLYFLFFADDSAISGFCNEM